MMTVMEPAELFCDTENRLLVKQIRVHLSICRGPGFKHEFDDKPFDSITALMTTKSRFTSFPFLTNTQAKLVKCVHGKFHQQRTFPSRKS